MGAAYRTPGGMGWNLNNYFGRANKIYNEKPIHGPGFKDTKGKNLPYGVRIPDWKKYKVETSAEFVEVQRKLAAHGLKDPWVRNHVWRMDRNLWGTPADRNFALFRSVKWGVLAFLITVLFKDFIFKEEDAHGHHVDDKYLLLYEIEAKKRGEKLH